MFDKRMKIGLALGSGGPRGLAHIGVIKALVENKIPIDVIAGSSAGALIGGLYATLGSIDEVEKVARTITLKDLIWIFSDLGSLSGIIRGQKIEEFLAKILAKKTIETLSIPFAAVATDVITGEAVAIKNGDLAWAIRASGSVPALINTAYKDERCLIDGGGSFPVPVRTVKDMGATFVIAVNLDVYNFIDPQKNPQSQLNITDMGIAAIRLLRFNLARELCREADVTITPEVADISSINLIKMVHGEAIINKGYTAAQRLIPKIRELIA